MPTAEEITVIEGPAALRRHRLVLTGFWIYAAALFTGTHWPKLDIPVVQGNDKIIHMGAFGTWTVLCAACGWFGRPLSDRNLLRTLLLAGAYAGVDESLQAFEFVHRSAELADYAANAIGVFIAGLALLLLRRWLESRRPIDDE
jgi:hypothetical protein